MPSPRRKSPRRKSPRRAVNRRKSPRRAVNRRKSPRRAPRRSPKFSHVDDFLATPLRSKISSIDDFLATPSLRSKSKISSVDDFLATPSLRSKSKINDGGAYNDILETPSSHPMASLIEATQEFKIKFVPSDFKDAQTYLDKYRAVVEDQVLTTSEYNKLKKFGQQLRELKNWTFRSRRR
jgi:hypothetical protein